MRGQADRGHPDHRRPVAVLVDLGGKRRGDLRQRPLGVAPPERVLGQQAAGDVLAEPVRRPERLQPGPALPHHRVPLAHLDEQGHGREPGLGDRGGADREPVRELRRVIPLAFGVVRQIVDVLEIQAVGGQAEPLLLRPRHPLVGGRGRTRQVAALQPRPGELVRGPQLDAEHLRVPGLVVRRGEQADRLVDLAGALAELT